MNEEYFYKCPNCGTSQPYVLKRKKYFIPLIILGLLTFPLGLFFIVAAFSVPKEKYCPNCHYHLGEAEE